MLVGVSAGSQSPRVHVRGLEPYPSPSLARLTTLAACVSRIVPIAIILTGQYLVYVCGCVIQRSIQDIQSAIIVESCEREETQAERSRINMTGVLLGG